MHEAFSDPLPFEYYEEERPIGFDAPRSRRECFIPLQKQELIRHLSSDVELTPEEKQEFLRFSQLFEIALHHDVRQELEKLKELYALFDPDLDTKSLSPLSGDELSSLAPEVFERLAKLLEQANFRRLSPEDIERAISTASHWGLRLDVDFSAFERLLVFSRGDVMGKRVRRVWSHFYKPEEIKIPIFQRLVVAFRLRRTDSEAYADTSKIYIKMFKNIPHVDVDMLLPGTLVRMSWFDRCRIILPSATGIGIAIFKIFKGAVILAVAGLYGFLGLLGFVGGTIGYGVRSFFGYLQTKDKYQLNLTRSLYFQNLATNAGVLYRLLDEAEEQDLREVLLAYFLLWRRGSVVGWTATQIDEACEDFVRHITGVEVDFEITDSLRKLVRFGLVTAKDDGRWSAISPVEAATKLAVRRVPPTSK